jgi:hypothetical protein
MRTIISQSSADRGSVATDWANGKSYSKPISTLNIRMNHESDKTLTLQRTTSPNARPRPCAYCGSISMVSSPLSPESDELK